MIGQHLFADEDEAVFAEMAIAGGVVDIFDDVMVVLRTPRDKAREFIEALDFFEVVAAVSAHWPGDRTSDRLEQGFYRRRAQARDPSVQSNAERSGASRQRGVRHSVALRRQLRD